MELNYGTGVNNFYMLLYLSRWIPLLLNAAQLVTDKLRR
jgi:hypothetical protein